MDLYVKAAEHAATAEESCSVACAAAKMPQGGVKKPEANVGEGEKGKGASTAPAASAKPAPKAQGMAGWADRTLAA